MQKKSTKKYRIVSWNVNGFRAALSKGVFADLEQLSPDVLCFQEIKMKEEQLPPDRNEELEKYIQFWNSAERPGYSGVATFSKEIPVSVDMSMGDEEFDIEGRFINLDFGDFNLINVYVPNGKRDQTRLSYKLNFYDKLLHICDELHKAGKLIVICGDINTAHQPIDLKNPKQNEKVSGFLPQERAWIDKYLQHGFIDVYREVFGDRVQYTWWTYRVNARERNIGWRLDYFLVSSGLLEYVEETIIHDQIEGSDHCPIELTLSF
jgi:exodeoxyribonuclease-3